jgi:hypothetical protein
LAGEQGTRIQLCGRFVARIEGRRIEHELPSRQGRLLFAFLTLHRERPVRRDELVEALWQGDPAIAVSPDGPQAIALNPQTLQAGEDDLVLAELRRLLETRR